MEKGNAIVYIKDYFQCSCLSSIWVEFTRLSYSLTQFSDICASGIKLYDIFKGEKEEFKLNSI